ncbi:hypothetical protein ACFORL_04640 [Legionella dresdenensis]|uniref:Uncharacterized protein n=1 Tax=Legionella dresdenensis TaxID=450200 RepID=A0ABV8CEI6_9GAMM
MYRLTKSQKHDLSLGGNTEAAINFIFETYPADGVDDIKKTINGDEKRYIGNPYRVRFKTLLTSFLGLPNRQFDKESEPEILNNFMGWNPGHSRWKNILTALFAIPLNVVITPSRLVVNLVKAVTELVPGLTYFALQALLLLTESAGKGLSRLFGKPGEIIGYVVLGLIQLLLYAAMAVTLLAYTVGQAFTSPIEFIRGIYETVKGSNLAYKAIFMFAAVGLVMAVYGTAFAFAWPVVVTKILPGAIAQLPLFVATLNNTFTTGAIVGFAVATVGPVLNKLVTGFTSWWHKPRAAQLESEKAELRDAETVFDPALAPEPGLEHNLSPAPEWLYSESQTPGNDVRIDMPEHWEPPVCAPQTVQEASHHIDMPDNVFSQPLSPPVPGAQKAAEDFVAIPIGGNSNSFYHHAPDEAPLEQPTKTCGIL